MLFRVLGPVTVVAGDQRVALGRRRRDTILAVLLAAGGETVTTDRLVDALWGTDPPPTARKSVQSHVSRLRGELQSLAPDEPEPVVGEADGYRVNLDAHDLDAERFASLVDRARIVDDEKALALLEEAEACWRGPAFGDLASDPGLRIAARHLEELRAAATAERFNAWLACGRHEEALAELTVITEWDPFDERSHGQLMRALVHAGRQAEALAVFRDLQERLRDELGVDPSAELRQLHADILRQDPAVARPAPSRPLPEPVAERSRADRVFGRDRDIETLTIWMRTTPLVTLTGPGGVGKTRLAEWVVERVAPSFRDGVATCALAHVRDAEGVGGALITALGIQPTGGQTVEEALVSALGDRHLLLFLDNCEHVLDALLPPIEAIVTRCRDVSVVSTSRERLRLPGEHVWPVTPLDVPAAQAASVDEIVDTSAGALFQIRAEAVDPTFALTDGNAAAVAELCRRLDGMPLAIELAAARVRALSPAALVERLDQRFAVVAGGPRHVGGRHRTLEAVVEWSYDLLASAEAELFDRLAVFAGAFPLAAVEEVCGGDGVTRSEVADLLGELVDKSMVVVQRTGEDVRYRLLDTMRDFAMQRLSERGITEDVQRAHAAYYVALAEAEGARICGPEERIAGAVITSAIDDLRAAHAWSTAAGQVDAALRIPAALADEVLFRLRDEVTTWARRALALPGARDHPAYAAALATAAVGATSRDECERAVREANEALARERDKRVAVLALGALETAAIYEGRLADVLELAERADETANRLGDDYHKVYAGVCRVLGHLYRGERGEAEKHVSGLRRVAEDLGNPTMRAFARYCDGEVHLDTRPDDAAAILAEAVDLARSVDNQLLQGVSLVCLASLQGRRGKTRDSLRLFREVVDHWRRVGDRTHQLTTLRNLVELLAQIEADEAAAILYGAVTAGDTPTYGVEAERLAAAWEQVEGRLGSEPAEQLAAQGRRLGATRMGDEALTQLDALLGD